jgi:hypothetical protein
LWDQVFSSHKITCKNVCLWSSGKQKFSTDQKLRHSALYHNPNFLLHDDTSTRTETWTF